MVQPCIIITIVHIFYFSSQGQVYSDYSTGYAQNHREEENHQDLNKVPGTPGVDYPIYHEVPETNFHCKDVPYAPGMYANVETGCQVGIYTLLIYYYITVNEVSLLPIINIIFLKSVKKLSTNSL